MKKITANDPLSKSADVIGDNLERMKALFPEAFTEGRVDFEVLKQMLGGAVDEREEKYGLVWHGKREARQNALAPSAGTLLPCPEESVEWSATKNVFIEGENLETLKLLQKSYAGKVKLVYIDPPYNTGNEFVYPDNYRDSVRTYLELTGQLNHLGRKLSSNTEASGRFHTDWLNMMYPRLRLARSLLRRDGVLLVSIDDHEVASLRMLLDEVFGVDNLIATFVWKRKAGGGDDSDHVAIEHEYILCYGKDRDMTAIARIEHESPSMTAKYNRSENGRRYYLERLDKTSLTYSRSMDFAILCPDGTEVRPPQPDPDRPTTAWRWGATTVDQRRGELIFERDKKTQEWRVYTKTWESLDGVTARSLLIEPEHGRNRDGTQDVSELIGPRVFSNPKPLKLLRHLIGIAANEDDALVLDFFGGSGSTGHAVMAANAADGKHRRFVPVHGSESGSPWRSGIDSQIRS